MGDTRSSRGHEGVVPRTDGTKCVVKTVATTAVITKHTPVLESGDRVLDPRSAAAMDSPVPVTHDASMPETWSAQLVDAAIAAIGQDSSMGAAERLDGRPSVVNRIVAVSGAARFGGDDGEVASANQDLGVARPAVVLGLRRAAVIAGRDEGSVENPRESTIVAG